MRNTTKAVVRAIDWTLNTDVAPISYLVTIHTLLFGLLTSTGFLGGGTFQISQLGPVLEVDIWGLLLALGAASVLGGFILKYTSPIIVGSLLVSCMWIFAIITYIASGLIGFAILGFITMNYFAYFMFGATMGRLWGYTPYKFKDPDA